MNLIPANLASVADLCADSAARYSMTGVHLRVTESSYTAEATDGMVAVRVTGPCDLSHQFPQLPALASAPNGATEAVIPVGDWRAAFKAIPKPKVTSRAPILRNVAVVLGEKVSTLATTDGTGQSVYQPAHVDGLFPQLDYVYSKQAPSVRIDFNPRKLLQVLKAALAFLPADNERVTLELFADGRPNGALAAHPARIVAHNGEQTFDALVMPLSK